MKKTYKYKLRNIVDSYRLNTKKIKCLQIALLFGLLFSILFSVFGFAKNCEDINQNVLRLHILANSDSEEDQALKLKVRDSIIEDSRWLFDEPDNIEIAKSKAILNIDEIKNTAKQTIKDNGYDYDVNIELVNMYFSIRNYDNFTLPSGYYDAVRIIIGEGQGKNWWCVLYPSMCLSAASDGHKLQDVLNKDEMDIVQNYNKYEIKFKFLEFINSLGL